MKLIAGIDIKNGKCVHLTQGNAKTSQIFPDDPIELIKLLNKTKIDQYHIVDIDGVFSGQTRLLDLLKKIRACTNMPIQFGGGIRNFETAKAILDLGIDQVVLGTSAVKDQELLVDLVDTYGKKIIVAADIYDNQVFIDGWEENTAIGVLDFLHTLELIHVETVMVTDIKREGSLSSSDFALIDAIQRSIHINLIVSGGINSDHIIQNLEESNIEGVVVGTALYEGLISV
jgi:phosphoribosylformimino-5-aminoimidazole carboxamide ribotide isomerase